MLVEVQVQWHDVKEGILDRRDNLLAANDPGTALDPQRNLPGDTGVLIDERLDLVRSMK